MANFPFAKPAAAPKEVPKAQATEAVAETPAKAAKTKKASGERKKPAAQMTVDQVKEILSLIKDHSYGEIAEKVGVTKFQVNRVLMTTKKQLREAAAGDPAKLAKVEEYIKEYLSRPENTLPGKGGGARQAKVKSALDDIVANILASIS